MTAAFLSLSHVESPIQHNGTANRGCQKGFWAPSVDVAIYFQRLSLIFPKWIGYRNLKDPTHLPGELSKTGTLEAVSSDGCPWHWFTPRVHIPQSSKRGRRTQERVFSGNFVRERERGALLPTVLTDELTEAILGYWCNTYQCAGLRPPS